MTDYSMVVPFSVKDDISDESVAKHNFKAGTQERLSSYIL